MAVKRTNNLSSTISSLDRRIRTAENSGIATSTTAITTTTVADDQEPVSGANLSSASIPYSYKRVVDAYIYGPKVTGNTSRAEIYLQDDPEVVAAQYIQIQGIHGNTADEIDISGTFKIYDVDEDPWDDGVRATQSWRDVPPEPTPGVPNTGVTNTVWYNPVVVPPSDSPLDQGVQLITKRLVDSVSASNTTVTVNFNSNHRFAEGDVLYFDLPSEVLGGYSDKLFRVSNVVDSNTVEYELDSALGSPVTLTSGDLGTVYVYPVAHRYVEDGQLWTDTSVEPNKVYIWKDYRWYDTTDAAVAESSGADTIAPSPVSNLSATSDVSTPAGPETSGKSSITLTWDAPTTNENSTTITDLGGYSVWWRYTIAEPWRIVEIDDPDTTTWFADDFAYNVTVLLAVYAKDIWGNRSTAATTSILTSGTPATALVAPSAPTITGYLGTMKVYWDGLDTNGDPAATSAFEVQLHISSTDGFTAGSSTLYERFPAINGATYTVIPGNAVIEGSEIVDGQTYYFRFKFVDIWGNTTGQSAQGSFVAQKSDIVTFDMIDVGTIDGEILIGADIRTSANPSVSGGLALDSNGLTAYNNVGVQTFNISAATGAVLITGYATDGDLGAVESVAISANSIAVTANTTANSAYSTAITANGIAVTANTTGNTAITRINAGDITVTKAKAVGAINEGIDPGNTTTISGGTITTGSIDASKISADTIYTGLLKTGASGTNRIEIRGSSIANSGIVHLDGSGGSNFKFYANGYSYLNNLDLANANLTGTLTVSGTVSGGSFTGGSFTGGSFTGGSFTGGTFRTASGTDQRVIISGTTNRAAFYNTGASDASPTGYIQGTSLGLTLNAASQISFEPGGSQVAYVSSSGMGFNGADKRWIGTFSGTASVQSGNGSVILGSTGNISADGSITAAGNITSTGGNVVSELSVTSGTTVIVGVMNTTSLAANVRHGANGSALTRFTSDSRIKDNITTITTGLDIVNQLNPVTFNSLVDDTDRLIPGFIAQDLEEVFDESIQIVTKIDSASLDTSELPEGIDVQSDPLRSIETVHLLPYLVKAIQELSQQNSELQARIAALEGN